MGLGLRVGFEIELLAPPGSDRRALADRLATVTGGSIRPIWHADSEPAAVPGLGRFLHLTLGWQVTGPGGEWLASVVDDVTLRSDLDPAAPPKPGWYRVLTDDPRLLALLERTCDPARGLSDVLDGAAALWGVGVGDRGGVKVLELPRAGTIALAAPDGGERERPAELVTAPIEPGGEAAVVRYLAAAVDLGFAVPAEAAVHMHLDAAPFRDPHTLANLIRLFGHWRDWLHQVFATNPRCRRLAPLPAELVAYADAILAGRAGADPMAGLRQAAAASGLSKFHDVNLTGVLGATPVRDTVEVRILPGRIDADRVLTDAVTVESLVRRCRAVEPVPLPGPGVPAPIAAPAPGH